MTEPRDPVVDVAAALFMDKLTTPDSEDRTILPDGDTIHVSAYREVTDAGQRRVMGMWGSVKLSDLRARVRNLPPDHAASPGRRD